MRAIRVERFGGPAVLTLRDVPDPDVQPGRVLVRVHAAGVNPVDAYIRTGKYARLPVLPYTPGFDGAGVIEAVGSGVAQWQAGDRVYIATLGGGWEGTYAERALYTPTQVHKLPAHVSFAAGAAVGVPAATAYRALFQRAQAQRGETVLVHGASGAVGIAAVQLAAAAGMTVLGTAGTDEGLALVTAQGATKAFNHGEANHIEQIRAATDGRGVNVILEMLANVNLDADLGLLASRGRVVVIGSRGRVEIDPRQTMAKDAAVLGMALWNVPGEEMLTIHTMLVHALDEGMLRPVVGHELPLADAARAHELIFEPGATGKIVLTCER